MSTQGTKALRSILSILKEPKTQQSISNERLPHRCGPGSSPFDLPDTQDHTPKFTADLENNGPLSALQDLFREDEDLFRNPIYQPRLRSLEISDIETYHDSEFDKLCFHVVALANPELRKFSISWQSVAVLNGMPSCFQEMRDLCLVSWSYLLFTLKSLCIHTHFPSLGKLSKYY